MVREETLNIMSKRDETLAHAYYSAGILPMFQVTRFEYSASRHGLLGQIADRLGARLNAPLPQAHRALLDSDAEQTPEDLTVVTYMAAVQHEALTS